MLLPTIDIYNISNEHHKPRSGIKVDSSPFTVMAYKATIHSGV